MDNIAELRESTPCELCGSAAAQPLVQQPDYTTDAPERFRFVRCQGCGALRQNPRPTAAAIGAFYPADYLPYRRVLSAEPRLRRLVRRYGLRKRLRALERHTAERTLLDVGCATGDLLAEAEARGWQVAGIEPNASAAAVAASQLRGPVAVGTLNRNPFAPDSFAVVSLWDVLEHVTDPGTVLDEAACLLKSGGILALNLPNVESLDRRLFGRFWCGYDLPRHLYLFPAALLRRLLAERGLTVLKTLNLYGSYSAFVTSLIFLVRARFGAQAARQSHALLLSLPARVVAAPLFWLIDRTGYGANTLWIAQKT